jgi:hypothetical protein
MEADNITVLIQTITGLYMFRALGRLVAEFYSVEPIIIICGLSVWNGFTPHFWRLEICGGLCTPVLLPLWQP